MNKIRTQGEKIIYVVGAGLSAGLGFPLIGNLLPKMWPRIESANLANDLGKIIRFHHPSFQPECNSTFPNIEQLLSEMQANEHLFTSSRPAIGTFKPEDLLERRQSLLLELVAWFHELQRKALEQPPAWLSTLVNRIKTEKAQVISFNWDLVLDELLFDDGLDESSYGFGKLSAKPCLIKPHGSLNWYMQRSGQFLSEENKFSLGGHGKQEVFAFRLYRAPKSKQRTYMPLIIPPVYAKQFQGRIFKRLWQKTVSALSVASEVRFLGYSMAPADFHARFILRCCFHNQEEGALDRNGVRRPVTGRARVIIVDPCVAAIDRIEDVVGWDCERHRGTIQEWVELTSTDGR